MIAEELRSLYQEVILDHYKRPRNLGRLEGANRRARGDNPLCGDKLDLEVQVEGDEIKGIAFQGSGCAISTASASLMTDAVKGKPLAEVERLFADFHKLLTGDPSVAEEAAPELGKLAVFAGVREYPVRVKCATLSWHTLKAALDSGDGAVVSTE